MDGDVGVRVDVNLTGDEIQYNVLSASTDVSLSHMFADKKLTASYRYTSQVEYVRPTVYFKHSNVFFFFFSVPVWFQCQE